MAGNHLNIAPNLGEASYWDATPAIQQFSNLLAQRKAEQQRRDQELINQIGQLRPEAIRDADKQDYINKYNDWKQSQMVANQLPTNSRQRLDALGAAQQKYNDLNNFIYESKKEAGNEHVVSNSLLQNPHLFSDEAHNQLLESMRSPMSNAKFIPGNDYNRLERYVDHTKIDDGFDAANKELLKQQEWSNPIQSQGHDRQGNKTGVVVHNERQVEPEDILSTHAHMYTLSPDIRASIDKRYANIVGDTPQQTMMLRLRQNAIDRGDLTVDANGQLQSGVTEKTKPEFKANYRPDLYYEHRLFALEHPAGGGEPAQPQEINIPFAKGGVVHAPNYVPLSLPNKNFAGASGVNLETGKPERSLASSDTYSIVGAGDFPVSKVTGEIAQPNWAAQHPNGVVYKRMLHVQQKDPLTETLTTHLVPYENLPKNIANQKDVRTALGGLNKMPVYGSQAQTYKAVNGKQYNHQELLKLGYTEDQIKQALKLGTLK